MIRGTAGHGKELACSTGSWTNQPSVYTYQWSRFGTAIVGATRSSYEVTTLDEGATLTCAVTAANAAGAGRPASSRAVTVAAPHVRGCPTPTGSASGTRLGQAKLGMTRAQARRAYTHSSTHGKKYEDFFCLTPIGVRVGYASPRLLAKLPAARRRSLNERVLWVSTSNPYYAVAGVRPGASLAVARRALPDGHIFHVGLNFWYLRPHGAVTVILKVRKDVVDEVGIAEHSVTNSVAVDQSFLHSFS